MGGGPEQQYGCAMATEVLFLGHGQPPKVVTSWGLRTGELLTQGAGDKRSSFPPSIQQGKQNPTLPL